MQTIDVKRLADQQAIGKIDLIDVRMPTEFREVHCEGAQNFPLDSLDPQAIAAARNGRSGVPLYLICKSGNRSSKAVQKFIDAGIENVVSVDGGTTAWVEAGLPVVRGKKAVSLERQVRIAAGSIVFIGSVAAMVTGNVYLAGIPAFIGAGLAFAGITDTCGMGMMLSKMPWNQCSNGESCSV
jgi:rhodanese-related sulfurtransferase